MKKAQKAAERKAKKSAKSSKQSSSSPPTAGPETKRQKLENEQPGPSGESNYEQSALL